MFRDSAINTDTVPKKGEIGSVGADFGEMQAASSSRYSYYRFKTNIKKKSTVYLKNEINSAFLASSAGFEPTAFRLGGGRSIRLSYEDIFLYNIYFISKVALCQAPNNS